MILLLTVLIWFFNPEQALARQFSQWDNSSSEKTTIAQQYNQGNTQTYGNVQGYPPPSYQQTGSHPPPQNFPAYNYQSSSPPQQIYYQPPAQNFKRVPRMPYQDTSHHYYPYQGVNQPQQPQIPPHYQTNRATQYSNNGYSRAPLINRNTLKQNMFKAVFGGNPSFNNPAFNNQAFTKQSGNYNTTGDGSAISRALDQRSQALSEADQAESCADRASYGSRDVRQDAAYEARSHARYARIAAEKAEAAAAYGNDEAKGYAADAWAASDRAQSAASRAEDSARTNVQ